jgi:hypothetical protein
LAIPARLFVWAFMTTWVATSAPAAELIVAPTHVQFDDLLARRQLLASVDGKDVTRSATYQSSDPSVARVDSTGYVVPVGKGETGIVVTVGAIQSTVLVTVTDGNTERPIDFANDVVPLLSRFGCNSGGCHGKASGQNGFKLSLFGFDTRFDYAAIVEEARGRRVFPAAPERSLLLLKAAAQVPHGGGRRIDMNGEPYAIIRQWIAAGMPPASADAPKLVKLHVEPAERVMKPDEQQQLAVVAEYDDGRLRDVTRQTEFSSNLGVVAAVDPDALVTATGQSGEATVMARYMGQVAVFRAMVPHGQSLAEIPDFQPANYIDRLCAEKWKRLGLLPSPLADDATYLRRVTLDICGRLPTVKEAREFLADPSPTKREAVADRLLATPDYAAFFALRWGTILRNSRLAGADQAAYAFHNWLKDLIARNRPYDELVRGVVAAAGEWQDAPAINWYWQMRDDQLHQVTADTAQVFLGVRLQCARCHHHPYERWGQEDYFGLAGFFTRLGRKSFGQPPPYFSSPNVTTGEQNPLTGRTPEPKFPDGEYAKFTPEEDPRHALVDWMTRLENPYFAKVLVNRLWAHFMASGLVNEIDDLRATNPPSNPELLDALAKDFVGHQFDMRHIIRTIVTSRTYQLSSEPIGANRNDRQSFARHYARRLIAEVFLDAVDEVTGSRTRFSGVSSTARAVDLPHEGFGSYFLDAFDRPQRVTACECERSSGATLAQVLLLANSNEIENKIADGSGRIARMFKAKMPMKELVEELYLAAYSRYPTGQELNTTLAYIESMENKQQAAEDVLWTLLNSKEFAFNH